MVERTGFIPASYCLLSSSWGGFGRVVFSISILAQSSRWKSDIFFKNKETSLHPSYFNAKKRSRNHVLQPIKSHVMYVTGKWSQQNIMNEQSMRFHFLKRFPCMLRLRHMVLLTSTFLELSISSVYYFEGRQIIWFFQ